MKYFGYWFWGALLLMVGIIWLLKTLGGWDEFIGFDGWWTGFIILPCLIRLFCYHDKLLSLLGAALGIVLLCGARGYVETSTAIKIFLPIAVIIIAIVLITHTRCKGHGHGHDHC